MLGLNTGVVDDLSLLIAPVAEGENNTVTLFEKSSNLSKNIPVEFKLKDIRKTNGDGVWSRYLVKK